MLISSFASLFSLPVADPTTTFWLILTDLIVALALITAACFALLALVQWFRRKSFRKIDPELRWALLPLALLVVTYIIFEKIWILDYRPNGSGEPSFPSTHTMLTATIFFLTIIILPKYLKNRTARLTLDALMLVAVFLVALGRVLAHMHWPTDVIGGLIFSAIFAIIYALILGTVKTSTLDASGIAHPKSS